MNAPFALSDRPFTRYSGEVTSCAVLEEYSALRDVPYDCQGTGTTPTDCSHIISAPFGHRLDTISA